jgi:hypothetical protein
VRDQKVRDEGIQKSSPPQLGAQKYRGDEAPLPEKTRFVAPTHGSPTFQQH